MLVPEATLQRLLERMKVCGWSWDPGAVDSVRDGQVQQEEGTAVTGRVQGPRGSMGRDTSSGCSVMCHSRSPPA